MLIDKVNDKQGKLLSWAVNNAAFVMYCLYDYLDSNPVDCRLDEIKKLEDFARSLHRQLITAVYGEEGKDEYENHDPSKI